MTLVAPGSPLHLELGYAGCVVVQINGAPVDAANVESVYAAAVAGRGDDKIAVRRRVSECEQSQLDVRLAR